MSYASTFRQVSLPLPTAIEKLPELGKPVVTVNTLDWVASDGDVMLAVTRMEVWAVPALTTVCAVPSAPVVALAGDSVRPPTDVFKLKLTVAPGRGPPV